jgi:quercetin dioxygenase-like cupin family protein
LILQLFDARDGVETQAGHRMVYDVARDEALFGDARVEGHALHWEIARTESPDALLAARLDLDPGPYVMRCDRVDFPPGGVAHTHVHPGPGIRCLLFGRVRIESGGDTHEYGPFEAWYESGPEPVFAAASETEPSAFVRVMILPREWAGKRTIRYVDPADEEKPKTQRATVFREHMIEL